MVVACFSCGVDNYAARLPGDQNFPRRGTPSELWLTEVLRKTKKFPRAGLDHG